MQKKRISLEPVIFLLLLTSIFLSTAVAQPPIFEKEPGKKPEARYVPGEIIVKFKPGVRDEVIRDLNQRHGCSVLSISRFAGFRRLRIPKRKTVEEMVKIYGKNPNIDYAEPNYIAYALLVPNDEYYDLQWHMDDTYNTNPYGGDNGGGINVEPAWDISTGEDVIVAVIDTGVAYEDYGKKFKLAPDLANTDFVPGYDFVNNDSHPNDDEGHGTHVTGTIVQSTNNDIGVAGIAFNTSVMPVKVLSAIGSGTYADVADGIYFAADNGADVINMSLGGTSPSITLENAVAYAYRNGVVIVCAAGNEYERGNLPLYPAAYDAYCIAVGASTYDETRAYYSNTGAYLDLAAPGGDIYKDLNNDGYGDGVLQQTFGSNPTDFGYWFYQGTSMASPHVAGVAALLIANGTTGPDNVREALESTAEDHGVPGWDEEYGWGIVDAYAALNHATVSNHPPVANAGPDQMALINETLTFDGSGSYDTDGSIASYVWNFGDGLTGSGVTVDHRYTDLGTYTAKLTVTDDGGLTDTDTATVTISDASSDAMYVASIDMALKTTGINTSALSTVTIVDAKGSPIEGATVYGSWSDATSDADSGVTDANGRVTLESDKMKRVKSGTNFTFAVDDVVKPGWIYDSTDPKPSDSVIVP